MRLHDHPTAVAITARTPAPAPDRVDGAWLEQVARAAGVDDVAFVSLDHPDLVEEKRHVLNAFPAAVALVAVVVRMPRAAVRSPARSIANGAFHRSSDRVEAACDDIVAALEQIGVAALHPSVGFPMEMDRFPKRTWVVSHKTVAQAAGLGRIGLHRNLIHPRHGSFVLLGTVIVSRPIDAAPRTLDYNPCANCRLCVAACPVGAIHPDGRFDTAACLTHNYREFMTGFADWVGTIADSKDRWDFRDKTGVAENASWWQSLTSGPHYKAAYCIAACPAGEDVMGPFLAHRKQFVADVVEPLRAKVEPVYVLADSDAEAHVRARFPHKQVRRVEGGLYADDIPGFLQGAPLAFQPGRAGDLHAQVAFRFTGANPTEVTFRIAQRALHIEPGLSPTADVRVEIDGRLWLELLRGQRNPVWLVLTRRMRITGDRAALNAFQRCFPGKP
jgi:ferredoxin